MKIRQGYVSNSSSSSFLVSEDLTDKGISCLKLNLAQKNLINGSKNGDNCIVWIADINKDLYLTQFISGCDSKYDIINKIEHVEYMEGQLNEEPRDEEYFNEYQVDGFGNSVYLLKEHDEAKQMTFKQFVKYYKDSGLPQEFIVKHNKDGFEFKYVQ